MAFDPTINFPSSPTSNRGFQYPRSGPNNAAEYVASGLPYSEQVNVTGISGSTQVSFPFVTSELYIKNRGSTPLAIGWTHGGVQGTNKHTLLQNEAVTFRIRVKDVFLLGVSGAVVADVTAAMTMVSSKAFPTITGSAANPSTGEFGFASESLERVWGWSGVG